MSVLLSVDRNGADPLWKQIVTGVARLVDEGTLAQGDRLPASRVLAGRLGLNRSTVSRAYEELWALGYIESRPGSYSTVRGRSRRLSADPPPDASLIDWSMAAAPGARLACDTYAGRPKVTAHAVEQRTSHEARGVRARHEALGTTHQPIDFASLTADPDLCPIDAVKRAIRQALVEDGAEAFNYGDAAGDPRLRETLARRLRTHGVTVAADDLLITQGAQQAIDLVLRLFAVPGAPVALEVPTYGYLVPLLRLLNLRPLEIPMTPDGLDLDALESRIRGDRPLLVYTMPNFQNPTGITTSQAHRERLLAICEAARVPILEDGFEEEMKYFGRSVLPIKSMDTRGIVIYIGTFSKVIFPGLRVGWIAADRECIRYLTALNRFTSLAGSTLAQAAAERFCATGGYDAYVRRLHTVYRRRMQALLRGLETHMPPGVEWTRPMGGATLLMRVPRLPLTEEPRLLDGMRAEGVAVAPGSLFFPTPPDSVSWRISIARMKSHEVDEGCRRLARALRAVTAV